MLIFDKRHPKKNGAFSKNKGFTFIGLMVAITIIGIVATTAISIGSLVQRRDSEEELLFIGLQFRNAFTQYYKATPIGMSPYPTSLTDLLKDPRYPNTQRYLRQIFVDPITGKDDWIPIKSPEGTGIIGVHSSSGAQPIKIKNFPRIFLSFENSTKYSDWAFFYNPNGISSPASSPQ